MHFFLEHDGRPRSLGPGVLSIGSGREAGWRIEGRCLESRHALVSVERDGRVLLTKGPGEPWVELNGHPVATPSVEVRAGDEVRLGEAVFHLRQGAPHGAEEGGAYLRDVRRDRWYRLGDAVAIGRDLSCAVLLLDPEISRTHAEVLRDGEGWTLHPRRGVTLHNGHRAAEPTRLAEGDEVTVGQTTLRFTTQAPTRGAVAPARLSGAAREMAQMQTTFMSPLAFREQLRKRSQRRMGAVAVGVMAAVAAAALVAGAAGTGRGVRTPARAATGRDSGSAAATAAPAATVPDTAGDGVGRPTPDEPRLPSSVTPIEAGPAAEEPITAGAKRPQP